MSVVPLLAIFYLTIKINEIDINNQNRLIVHLSQESKISQTSEKVFLEVADKRALLMVNNIIILKIFILLLQKMISISKKILHAKRLT